MEKIYGGFKKGEKAYSYGASSEDFETIRAEIVVDNIAEGLDFMANYFGEDMGNKFFEWSYREVMTHERREELKALISKAKAAKAEEVVEAEAVEAEEEVLCSCGHSVPKSMVMSSSSGTCCPECYDRMSF